MPDERLEARKTAPPSLSAEDWGLLIILAALWGAVFYLTEIALTALAPMTLVAIRVAIGAATLWIIASLAGIETPKGLKSWAALFLLGLVNNVLPFCLIVYGQTHIEAGLASILNATTPVFAVIVAGLFQHDERVTPLRFIGVLVGLAGAALVIGPGALLAIDDSSTIGQLAVLSGALCYGFGVVIARRLSSLNISPYMLATGQMTAATALLTPCALVFEQPLGAEALARYAAISAEGMLAVWAAMVIQGVACTALAFLIYFRVIASAGAGNGALVTFLIPPFAILLGALFLGERLEAEDFLGMAVIGLGLALIDGRLLRR